MCLIFNIRGLLIGYYRIISYMNIFFTCKNTLVIALQLYRLYVVYAEKRSAEKKNSKNSKKNKKSSSRREQSPDIALVLAALESSGAASKYAIDLQSAPKSSKKGDLISFYL